MSHEGPSTSTTRASLAENRTKLLWALPIANGAGLLSLVGLVGAMPDPNYAVSALTVPFVLFGVGMSFGFASLNWGYTQMTEELCALQAFDRYAIQTERLANSSAVLKFASFNAETLRLVVPENEFVPLLKKLFAGLVDVEAGVWKDSEKESAKIDKDAKQWWDKSDLSGKKVRTLQIISHLCFGAAIVVALVAPPLGHSLQPTVAEVRAEARATQSLPAISQALKR